MICMYTHTHTHTHTRAPYHQASQNGELCKFLASMERVFYTRHRPRETGNAHGIRSRIIHRFELSLGTCSRAHVHLKRLFLSMFESHIPVHTLHDFGLPPGLKFRKVVPSKVSEEQHPVHAYQKIIPKPHRGSSAEAGAEPSCPLEGPCHELWEPPRPTPPLPEPTRPAGQPARPPVPEGSGSKHLFRGQLRMDV